MRIKSQAGRGGEVSNITYENIVMSSVQEAISISMFYSAGASGVAPVFKVVLLLHGIVTHVSSESPTLDFLLRLAADRTLTL